MSKKVKFATYIAIAFVPLLAFSITIRFVGWIIGILFEHYIDMVASWNNVYKAK